MRLQDLSTRFVVRLLAVVCFMLLVPALSNPPAAQNRFPQGARRVQTLDSTLQDEMRKRGLTQAGENEPVPNRNPAANRLLLKSRLEEAKRDSAALADMADSLRNELAKANENVMPVDIARKAEMLEKLAKKIRNWAKTN